ncbi:MAG: DUF983 domain-containing protein [Alphaproteobacteria bacterium]|nr:DUF983 domain-containing protein [Alphaproteobacteria bacterium]
MTETAVSPVAAGMRCRCPRCGEGALFKGRFTLDLLEKCPSCSLSYRFIDTGDGPAVFVIMALGFAILGGALILEFTLHPPIWVHGLLWVPATFILALGLLRPLKALLIALQFRHKASHGLVPAEPADD